MANSLQVEKPIINPLSGLDFLSSTNFQVAQDTTGNRQGHKSVFKNDYPHYSHYGRGEQADRPVLAQVMHKDPSFFKGDKSESTLSYEYRYMKKPVVLDGYQTLRGTNFKPDRDLSKINSFGTMYDHYFVPKMNSDFQRAGSIHNTYESHLPKGDPERFNQQWTDYHDKYRGHDTSVVKVLRAPCMHEGGPPTVKGDDKLLSYKTMNAMKFQGDSQPRVQPFPAPTGTNVPKGDPIKVFATDTIMKESYNDLTSQHQHNPYNKYDANGKLYNTHIQSEDCYKENDYKTTATRSYQEPTNVSVNLMKPDKHRNHSDFPEGDMHAGRVQERVSTTTVRAYHGNPPLGLHNTIVSGANLLTRSKVSLGDKQLSQTYYDTTNYDTFKENNPSRTYDRTKFHKESNIPVKYYRKEERDQGVSSQDFRDPLQKKIYPNNAALNNLKMSHILPQLSGPQRHNTTHQVMFTHKESDKWTYDSQRLQRSSVPIGTMTCQ